jgi:hypothetical protein
MKPETKLLKDIEKDMVKSFNYEEIDKVYIDNKILLDSLYIDKYMVEVDETYLVKESELGEIQNTLDRIYEDKEYIKRRRMLKNVWFDYKKNMGKNIDVFNEVSS